MVFIILNKFMNNLTNNLIFEIYKNKVVRKNIILEISDEIIKGMEHFNLFTNSDILSKLIQTYEDSVEYRKNKSLEQKKIKNFINENFLSNIKDIPFDVKKIDLYIQIEPERKKNFSIGGYFTPDLTSGIVITLNNVVKNKEEFKRKLNSILVHEMVHWRQMYDSKLQNKIIDIPKMSIGSLPDNIESIETEFNRYLLNPLELEAYATEYNYKYNNVATDKNIKEFSNEIFEEIFGESSKYKNEEIRQTITKLFKIYVNSLTNYINKYVWKEN